MTTTQEKSSQYAKSLQKSSQEIESAEIGFKVKSAELQLQSDVLATKQSLAGKEKELARAKGAYPLNAQVIINLQIEVEGLNDGLKRMEALQEELF